MYRLTSGKHFAKMIPFIRWQEEEKLQGEIHWKKCLWCLMEPHVRGFGACHSFC